MPFDVSRDVKIERVLKKHLSKNGTALLSNLSNLFFVSQEIIIKLDVTAVRRMSFKLHVISRDSLTKLTLNLVESASN